MRTKAEQDQANFWLDQCRAILAERAKRGVQLELPFAQRGWNGIERRNRIATILYYRRA